MSIHEDDYDLPGNVPDGADETTVITLEIIEMKSSGRSNFTYKDSAKTNKTFTL